MRLRDEALLKCLESLQIEATITAVVLASLGHMSEQEASEFERAYGKYNSAHYDLMRELNDGDDDES
ncbi:MAG: hypothetical protein LKG38_06085 [Atopobiaceae bacterium]|jgi:hypothetical protein|nr:hypothetical protein [Atopobiaceae bacterium]